jgi:hypothetical protein
MQALCTPKFSNLWRTPNFNSKYSHMWAVFLSLASQAKFTTDLMVVSFNKKNTIRLYYVIPDDLIKYKTIKKKMEISMNFSLRSKSTLCDTDLSPTEIYNLIWSL